MDGDSLIVVMGDQVDKVRITNLNVVNLDGLQFLTAFTELDASNNNNLQAIPFFSDSLIKFTCYDCSQLEIIPDFPSKLDTIAGTSWQISNLPSFPMGLKFIILHSLQQVSELPVFPPGLTYLVLRYFHSLLSFPVIPESCEAIFLTNLGDNCCPNNLPDTLNIPSSAKEFVINDFGAIFPFLPTDKTNLQRLEIVGTNISSMPSLYDFVNMDHLDLSNNALLKLDSIPFALQTIQVQGNPLICVENKPPLVADQLAEFEICP
ncbi:MAG: hypothetical protein OEQ53_18260 [Saprospiraceae bacterium]|nr:hypothetical protein [Saprospiraceae bacterium]